MAVLALHALFLTNTGHRCEESGAESQCASICFLGPELLRGVEAGMGLAAISGLSSRLTGKPVSCITPLGQRTDCILTENQHEGTRSAQWNDIDFGN